MTKLIERNTPIPAKKGKIFSTNSDNQASMEEQSRLGGRRFFPHRVFIKVLKQNSLVSDFILVHPIYPFFCMHLKLFCFFFQFSNVHVVSMVSQDYIFVFSLAALLIQVFEGERAKTKDNRYLHVEFFCVGLHTETCTVGYNALFAHLIGRKLMSMQI